ncbi:MAG: DEAD/DEAH box helicase [Myxococcota bacterium]
MSERQESLDQLLVYVRALKKPLQIVAQNDYARLESIKGLDQTVVAVIDKALELPFTPGQSELLREIRGQFARFSIMKLAEQRSAVGTSLQTLKVLERQLGVEPSESKPAEARAVEAKSSEARAAEPKASEARAAEPRASEARPAQPSRAEKSAEREKRASDGGRRDGKAKEGRGEKGEKGEKAEPKAEKVTRSDANDKELIERSPVRQSGGASDTRERNRSKNGKERERDKRASREKERPARNEARSAGATRVEERRIDPVVTAAPYVERDDQDLTWGRPRRLLVYQEEPILFLPPPLQDDETEEPPSESPETEASSDRASRRAARNHEFRQNRNERRDKHKRNQEGRNARGNSAGEAENSALPATSASAPTSTGQERRSSRDDRGNRDARSDRSSRDDRGNRDERSDRSSRDDRGNRDERSDRSSRDERSDRSSRDDRGNRDTRSDRSSRDDRGSRDTRSDRSSRDDRGNRDARGSRNHRHERGGRDDRGNRDERQGARPEREGRGPRDERRRRERPRGERRAPGPILELPDEPLPPPEFGPEDELLAASGLIEEIVPEGAISRFSPEYRALRLAQLQAEQAAQQAVSEEEASDEASDEEAADEDAADDDSADVVLADDVSDDMTAPDPVVVALDVEPPDLDELRKFDDAPVAEEFPPDVERRPDLYPPVEDEEAPSFDTDGDSEEGLAASDDELTVDLEDEGAEDVHDEDESDDDEDESDDDDDEDESDDDDDEDESDDDDDDDDEDESDDDDEDDDEDESDDDDEDESDDDDDEDESDDDDDEDESDDDDDEDESDDDDDEDESDDDDDNEADESDDDDEDESDDDDDSSGELEEEAEPESEQDVAAAETSRLEASEVPAGSVASEVGAPASLSGDAPQSVGGVGSVGLLAIAQVLAEVLNREPQPTPERTEDELNRLLATEAPDAPTPGDLSLISDDLTVHEVLVEVVESAARRSTLELARIPSEHSMGAVEAESDDEADGDDEEGSDADEAESAEASAGESRGRRRRRRRRRGGREQAVQAQEAVPTPPAPVLPVVSTPASVSPAAVVPVPHSAELSATRAERRAEAQKLLETLLSDPSVIGHRMGAILEGQGLKTVQDLLFFFPRSWLDRRVMRTISSLPIGEPVVFQASVDVVEMNYDDRSRNLQVRFSDPTGSIDAVWPNVRSNYLRNRFRQGGNVLVWGIVEEQDGRPLLVNPETELLGNDEEDTLSTGRIVPVYPSIEGLGQKTVRRLIKQVLGLFKGELPDPIPTSIRYRANVMPLEQALNEAHFPSAETDFTALEQRQTLALRTLIFADLLSLELALAHRRKALANETGMNLAIHQAKVARLLRRMGALTDAERQVLEDVKRDLASPHPMARLLLTDIGRVHKLMYLAIALAVEGEGQVAIIVPSENLVDQYAAVVREQLAPLKLEVDALTGAVRGRVRERLIHRLRRGEISVVIGTHALFNEGVGFKRLTLAVLDEQHRGSMIPRKQLQRRGFNPNLLVLNSAPMPRALLQTIYGDITWSRLPSAMPEEPPFSTRVVVADNRVECEASIRASLARGHQLLYVSPEEGGTAVDDPVRLEELAKKLRNEVFPGAQVGVFSHRLLPQEQELILKQLRTRQLQIVVTSPELDLRLPGYNLSSIVVERAELLTPLHLHALRSMLLASYNPANFYMVPGPEVTPDELEALTQLQEQYDGFVLAEQELQLRGVPELMGLRQLGISPAMSADLVTHGELVDVARREAFRWMDGCPEAEQPDLHKPLMSLVKMRWTSLLEGLTSE